VRRSICQVTVSWVTFKQTVINWLNAFLRLLLSDTLSYIICRLESYLLTSYHLTEVSNWLVYFLILTHLFSRRTSFVNSTLSANFLFDSRNYILRFSSHDVQIRDRSTGIDQWWQPLHGIQVRSSLSLLSRVLTTIFQRSKRVRSSVFSVSRVLTATF
jgi:hypothetical protein